MKKINETFKNFFIIVVVAGSFFAVSKTLAVGGSFRAGETLDPQCGPLDPFCTVRILDLYNEKSTNGAANIVTGNNAIAIGSGNVASGNSSIAIGHGPDDNPGAIAEGTYSVAIGTGSYSGGFQSTALGSGAEAMGERSTAIGYMSGALGKFSSAFGIGTYAPSFAEISLGSFPTIYEPQSATEWNEDDLIFSVGNGRDSENRSTAFAIRKDGVIFANKGMDVDSKIVIATEGDFSFLGFTGAGNENDKSVLSLPKFTGTGSDEILSDIPIPGLLRFNMSKNNLEFSKIEQVEDKPELVWQEIGDSINGGTEQGWRNFLLSGTGQFLGEQPVSQSKICDEISQEDQAVTDLLNTLYDGNFNCSILDQLNAPLTARLGLLATAGSPLSVAIGPKAITHLGDIVSLGLASNAGPGFDTSDTENNLANIRDIRLLTVGNGGIPQIAKSGFGNPFTTGYYGTSLVLDGMGKLKIGPYIESDPLTHLFEIQESMFVDGVTGRIFERVGFTGDTEVTETPDFYDLIKNLDVRMKQYQDFKGDDVVILGVGDSSFINDPVIRGLMEDKGNGFSLSQLALMLAASQKIQIDKIENMEAFLVDNFGYDFGDPEPIPGDPLQPASVIKSSNNINLTNLLLMLAVGLLAINLALVIRNRKVY